jgi:hypothetical protein
VTSFTPAEQKKQSTDFTNTRQLKADAVLVLRRSCRQFTDLRDKTITAFDAFRLSPRLVTSKRHTKDLTIEKSIDFVFGSSDI